MKKHTSVMLLLTLVGFFVYLNSLNNHFQFDDHRLMEGIKLIRNVKDLISLSPASRTIAKITFFLSLQLSKKLGMAGYRLMNIGIHILTGILIYWVVYFLFKSDYNDKNSHPPVRQRLSGGVTQSPSHPSHLPLFTALLFLVHPLCTEPVNYIIARSAQLTTLFSFAALLFFVLFLQIRKKIYFIGMLLSFFLAGYSKEVGYYYSFAGVFLCLCIFYPVNFFAKLRKNLWFFLGAISFLLVVLLFFWRYSGIETRIPLFEFKDLGRYFLTQNKVFLNYLRLMILPIFGLNVDHHVQWSNTIFEFPTLLSLVLNLGLLILAFFLKKKEKVISFAIFWLYLQLLPYFFLISEELMVEYRTYPAIFGFVLIVAWVLARMVRQRRIQIAVFSGIIIIFSLTTFFRNFVWREPISLWADAVKKSPEKARPHNNLGNTYALKGLYEQAIEELQKAKRLEPKVALPYATLALVYYRKGETEMAIEEYNNAIALETDAAKKAKMYLNLGNIYAEKKKYTEAIEKYKNALKIKPDYFEVCYNLGLMYHERKNYDEAIQAFKEVIKIYPDYVQAYNSLGIIYALKGWDNLAIEEYKKAIKKNPSFVQAYYNMGISYENLENLDEAMKVYQEALKINPHYLEAYNNLGNVYYKKGEYEKAIVQYRKALGISPDFAEAKNNLAEVEKLLKKVNW